MGERDFDLRFAGGYYDELMAEKDRGKQQSDLLPFETDRKPGVCRYCGLNPIVDDADDACESCREAVAGMFTDHLEAIAGYLADEMEKVGG